MVARWSGAGTHSVVLSGNGSVYAACGRCLRQFDEGITDMPLQRFFGRWLEQAQAVDDSGRWQRWVAVQPSLGVVDSAVALGHLVRDGGDPRVTNDLFMALVRVGSVEGGVDETAVTFLASLLVPGGDRVARTLRSLGADVDAVVAGQLWLHIREYPWVRRPDAVAKNVLMDCRRAVLQEYGASTSRRAALVPLEPPVLAEHLDELAPHLTARTVADQDLLELLVWARSSGVLQPGEASLLWDLAVQSAAHTDRPRSMRSMTPRVAMAQVAADRDIAVRTVRRQRDRAMCALRLVREHIPDPIGEPNIASAITRRPGAGSADEGGRR